MKAIDTHAHLFKRYYKEELDNIIEKSLSELEYVFNIGTDFSSLQEILNLNKKYPKLIPVLGLHPFDVNELDELKGEILEKIILDNKETIKAIGEIGLDYSRIKKEEEKEIQKKWFIFQLEIANKFKLPVVIHGRDAYEDIYKIISKFPNLNYIIHSYTGNEKMFNNFLKFKNLIFSFNGILTFKNAQEIKNYAKIIPLDKIIFETDCPYLTPVPFRGKTNYPFYLKYLMLEFSKIRDLKMEELITISNSNAKKFYRI
ncbi:TatD family hydrolase [Candidatus Hepatoplasma crinochetorum]|uniref:TatD family hydrolase n=1 Tax=Candidatus Hepatoplasma crinochetorum TaxID=295596 RepID=UPI003087D46C|nr:MAG: hydrolase TatD [Candidatus Hepatoplasma crinochetorum]